MQGVMRRDNLSKGAVVCVHVIGNIILISEGRSGLLGVFDVQCRGKFSNACLILPHCAKGLCVGGMYVGGAM